MAAPLCFVCLLLLARLVRSGEHQLLPIRGYHFLVEVAELGIVLRLKQRKAASQDPGVGDGSTVYLGTQLRTPRVSSTDRTWNVCLIYFRGFGENNNADAQ